MFVISHHHTYNKLLMTHKSSLYLLYTVTYFCVSHTTQWYKKVMFKIIFLLYSLILMTSNFQSLIFDDNNY